MLYELKQKYNIKTHEELARVLSVSKGQIDRWSSTKKIPKKHLKRVIAILNMNNFGKDNVFTNNNFYTNNYNNCNNIGNNTNENMELKELIELLRKYGNSKIYNELKEKLLKIKELTD